MKDTTKQVKPRTAKAKKEIEGPMPEQEMITGQSRDALISIGVNMATEIYSADSKANKAKRMAMLDVAGRFASDDDKTRAILEGYAEGLIRVSYSPSVVKVRKAEANVVFKAIAKTFVSGDNLKSLQAFDGGYNEFINLARDLSGRVTIHSSPRVRNQVVLTDKQVDTVDTLIAKADVGQLADVVDTASVQLNKITTPQIAGRQQLILINSIATNMMNNSDLEEYVVNIAKEIEEISQTAIDRLLKVEQDTASSVKATRNNVKVAKEVTH